MKLHEIAELPITLFKQHFTDFMKGSVRNLWIYGGEDIAVYIRKGKHMIGDTYCTTLDIANIQVENKGKGTGMRVIYWLHEQNPFQVTMVESIQNEGLYARLKKEGWDDVPNSNPPSVYLLK